MSVSVLIVIFQVAGITEPHSARFVPIDEIHEVVSALIAYPCLFHTGLISQQSSASLIHL